MAKIEMQMLDQRHEGVSRYLIQKKRGKLTLDEVEEACREHIGEGAHCVWQFTVHEDYGGWFDEDDGGDQVVIEVAEPSCQCPVCLNTIR